MIGFHFVLVESFLHFLLSSRQYCVEYLNIEILVVWQWIHSVKLPSCCAGIHAENWALGSPIPSQWWNQLSGVLLLSYNVLLQIILLWRKTLHECMRLAKSKFSGHLEYIAIGLGAIIIIIIISIIDICFLSQLWGAEINLKFNLNFISGYFWLHSTMSFFLVKIYEK